MDRKWWTLLAVGTGVFMLLLIGAVVAIAAALLTALLIRQRDFVTGPVAPAADASSRSSISASVTA